MVPDTMGGINTFHLSAGVNANIPCFRFLVTLAGKYKVRSLVGVQGCRQQDASSFISAEAQETEPYKP